MQKTFLTKENVTFLVILASISRINAADECNKCMSSNSVMCVDTTHFQVCNGGIPSATKHACANGTICTNSPKICITADNLNASLVSVCDASAGACAKCSKLFDKPNYACVSKTQYDLCINEVGLEDPQTCKTNEICNLEEYAKGGKICVPQCVADYANYVPTCGNDVPPTKAPIPLPGPEAVKAACLADCSAAAYCFTKDPTDCTRYFYCEKNGSAYDYVIMNCASGYWDNKKKDCSATSCPSPASNNF